MAEFALAVGLPTETGKEYLGEAVELRYRLPKTWARVVVGELPAWRARRIARETIGLSVQAAGFVDDNVAPYAHRIRPAEVDRLVADAIGRFMPAEAEKQRRQAADGRYFAIEHTQVSFAGTSRSTVSWTWPTPWTWRPGSPTKPPCWLPAAPTRRWMSAGRWRWARSPVTRPAWTSKRPTPTTVPPRQTVVHVHLSPDGPFARVEASGRRLVTVEQVREWLHTPLTQGDLSR